MKDNLKLLLKDFSISISIIFIVIFSVILISSIRNNKIKEINLIKGSYILKPYLAQKPKNLNLQPRTLENQTENFSYSFGRKLLKERQNRYIENVPVGEKIIWQLKNFEPGHYKVTVHYKSANKTNVKISSGIIDYTHELKPSKKWKNFNFKNDIINKEISIEVLNKGFDIKYIKLEKLKGDKK